MGGFGGVADRLNAYNIHLGDPARITTDLAATSRSPAQDIARVAALYLNDRPRVSLDVLGRKAADTSAHPRWTAPALCPGPAAAFHAPQPEVRQLSNGASSLHPPQARLADRGRHRRRYAPAQPPTPVA